MKRVSMEGDSGRGAAGDGCVGEVGLGWLKCHKNSPFDRFVVRPSGSLDTLYGKCQNCWCR